MVEEYYDEQGVCYESVEVALGGSVCALNIPAGVWHTLRSLETGTVILEVKDGAYEPIAPEDIMNV